MSGAPALSPESRRWATPPPSLSPTSRSSDPLPSSSSSSSSSLSPPQQWNALRLDGDTPRARATVAYASVVADRTVAQHVHCIACERRTVRRVLPVPLALERRMNAETGERCWGVFELYCCSPKCSLRFLARCDETLLPDGRVASLAYQREMIAAVYDTPTAEFDDGGGGGGDDDDESGRASLDPLFYEYVDDDGGCGDTKKTESGGGSGGSDNAAGDRRCEPCRVQRLSQRQNARLYRAEVLVVEHRYAYLDEKDDSYLYGLKRAERFVTRGASDTLAPSSSSPRSARGTTLESAIAPPEVARPSLSSSPPPSATALAPIAFKIGGTKRKRVRTMLTDDELKLDALVEDVIVGKDVEAPAAVSRKRTKVDASESQGTKSRDESAERARVGGPERPATTTATTVDEKKKKDDTLWCGGGDESVCDAPRFETLLPADRLSVLRIFDDDIGSSSSSSSSSSSDNSNKKNGAARGGDDDGGESRAAAWRACKWRSRVRDYGRRQAFTCRHCRRHVADGWPIAVVAERDIVTTQYGGETACCSPGCLVAFLTYAPEDALGRPRARLLKWATEMLFYAYGVVNAIPNPPRWLAAEFCRDGYEPDEFWRLGELGIHAATVGPGEQHDSFAPAASWRDMAAFSGASDGASDGTGGGGGGRLGGAIASRRTARVVGVLARKNYYRSDAVKQLLLESRQRRDAAAAARASKNGDGHRSETGVGSGDDVGGDGDDQATGAESDLLGDAALARPHAPVFAKLSGVAKLSARLVASHGGARPRSTIGSIYPPLT